MHDINHSTPCDFKGQETIGGCTTTIKSRLIAGCEAWGSVVVKALRY